MGGWDGLYRGGMVVPVIYPLLIETLVRGDRRLNFLCFFGKSPNQVSLRFFCENS